MQQEFITCLPGDLLFTLLKEKKAGYRIVGASPNYDASSVLVGYVVIIEK